MKNIRDFYNHLTENEKDLINKTLQKSDRFSKSKDLLNNISNYGEQTDNLLARDIYQEPPNSSFSHLKKRLKKNIIEIIYNKEISDQSNNSIFSDKAKCHKNLMMASMLVEKGFKEEAVSYLKDAEEIILDRQFTIERFMFHLLLLEVNESPKDSLSIYDNIIEDIGDLNELGKSKTLFHQLMIQGFRTTTLHKDSEEYLENNNALSAYYKLSADLKTNIELFQYTAALDCSYKLIALIQKSSKSFNLSEIAKARLMHLRALIYNNDFKSATIYCNQIEKVIDLRFDMETELNILKWQLFYLAQDYEKANKILERIRRTGSTSEAESILLDFFNLCLMYKQGHFEKITYSILKNNQLQSVSSPVPHATKLLEIYCHLEQKKTDLAHSRLKAFRQYLKRSNTLNRARYQYIVKVLLRLLKNNYQYGLTYAYYKKYASDSYRHDNRFVPDLHHFEPFDVLDWLRKKSIEIGDMHCETVII